MLSELTLAQSLKCTWTTTGSLATARFSHTATLQISNAVLISGGRDATGALARSERYDEATGTCEGDGHARHGQIAAHGDAASLGYGPHRRGAGSRGSLPSAELFDELFWTPTGSLASAELYDEATGTWTPTGSMATARYGHTATQLPSGRVLVTGGNLFPALASAELYDEATGTWTPTGSIATARSTHTATQLLSGRVLVAGGFNNAIGSLARAGLYDERMGTWTPTGSLFTARQAHTATPLPSGGVLVSPASTTRQGRFSRPPRCTTRQPRPGPRRSRSSRGATFTRRRCCPPVRCSSRPTRKAAAPAAEGTYAQAWSSGNNPARAHKSATPLKSRDQHSARTTTSRRLGSRGRPTATINRATIYQFRGCVAHCEQS